ncbi:helix-turn-helix domain-containing protein [Microbacterium soli]|uniref:Helix-turn-helix domain-containing protein n=1 Tax=Microbacterium soli TaxID=446075 RepID=A0ABP7NKP7_9MICO
MPKNRQKLISTNQAASLLIEHPRTVQRKAERGEYPAQKMPGQRGAYVFREADIVAIISKRLREAAKHTEHSEAAS